MYRRGSLLAIASGKGGVGKTWLAITLAHALSAQGARVLLVDADFGLANVDIQLGLMPERDLSNVLAGTAALGDAVFRHPAGFDTRPMPTHIIVNQASSPASGARVFATLAQACRRYLAATPDLLGIIRRDDRVRDAIRRQTPLLSRHPAAAAARDVEAIAHAIHA